jgi:antitoxin MazE
VSLTVTKWGHSLAIRIPKPFADQLDWRENTEIVPTIVDGKLVLEAVSEPAYDLQDLVAGITPENLHKETSTGGPVGNEAW